MPTINLDFQLYPKQLQALETPAQLIVYGGAAGSGKSHLCRVAAVTAALQIPGLQIYLFRRHYNELIKNHIAGPTGFPAMLADLIKFKLAKVVDCEIRFNNGPKLGWDDGSKIYLCHCQHEADVFNYKGPEFHMLIVEEATEFTEFQLRFLFGRCRAPDALPIPPSERHKWPRILLPTNPGGVGHGFIKSSFIDGKEPGSVWLQSPDDGGRTCAFIPARLRDNPSIDPKQYTMALMGLKRPELIDAMLNGKWDIPLGAFFPEADFRKHVIPDFVPPKHWQLFRTFDWGSGAPFCVQWWAVVGSEGYAIQHATHTQLIPPGSLVCYREWYGCNPQDTKQGIGLSNQQVCEGILERSPAHEVIIGTIADSKPFQTHGTKIDDDSVGPLTIASEFKKYGVILTKGVTKPGSRVQGWQQLRSRLIGIQETPYIYFTKSCYHTWRCLTEIQVDPKDVEDLDTTGEDHPLDAIGLAVKARTFAKDEPTQKSQPKYVTEATFDQVLANHMRYKRLEQLRG